MSQYVRSTYWVIEAFSWQVYWWCTCTYIHFVVVYYTVTVLHTIIQLKCQYSRRKETVMLYKHNMQYRCVARTASVMPGSLPWPPSEANRPSKVYDRLYRNAKMHVVIATRISDRNAFSKLCTRYENPSTYISGYATATYITTPLIGTYIVITDIVDNSE